MDRNPRSRGGAGGQISHALGGGSTSNLVMATSNAHLNLQQPHKSRSERDLTKVTKVRVRLSRDEDANAAAAKQPQQHSATAAAGRTKMKTTTMIGGSANDSSAVSAAAVPFVARERVDVVRAPLNWHLGCNLGAFSLPLAIYLQLYRVKKFFVVTCRGRLCRWKSGRISRAVRHRGGRAKSKLTNQVANQSCH